MKNVRLCVVLLSVLMLSIFVFMLVRLLALLVLVLFTATELGHLSRIQPGCP